MKTFIKIDTHKLAQTDHLALRQLVNRADGRFYEDALQAFAFDEAESRIEDHIGADRFEKLDKAVVDETADKIHEYLLDDEDAFNYDRIDEIVDETLEENGDADDDDGLTEKAADPSCMDGFGGLLTGMDDECLLEAMNRMQKTFFDRFAKQVASIDLENGHKLVIEASYGDYPQVEMFVDGDKDLITLATEFNDDDPDDPKINTYFYGDSDEVVEKVSQDFKNFVKEPEKKKLFYKLTIRKGGKKVICYVTADSIEEAVKKAVPSGSAYSSEDIDSIIAISEDEYNSARE